MLSTAGCIQKTEVKCYVKSKKKNQEKTKIFLTSPALPSCILISPPYTNSLRKCPVLSCPFLAVKYSKNSQQEPPETPCTTLIMTGQSAKHLST